MKFQLRPFTLITLAFALLLAAPAFAADIEPITTSTALASGMSVDEIVGRLGRQNAQRAAALHGFEGKRTYRLSYHGFPSNHEAEMEVVAHYQAPEDKSFDVVSETGSKLLESKVLRKLLESEQEAAHADNQRQTSLTPDNYSFTLLGSRPSAYGGCYRLGVEPKRDNKFLYRGEICVNATDFAVESIDAEPAKNPSFWIKKTRIEHRYQKVGQFWFPLSNKSVTNVRLGGTATLNIDYSGYEVR
jgi:opacity protein-like surface antigen